MTRFTFYQGLASGSYSVLAVGDNGAAATSGQGTANPATGERLVDPEDIEAQVAQAVANGRDALAKGGLALADAAFVTIFHVNPADPKRILNTLSSSMGRFRHEFIHASQLPGGQHVEIEFYTAGFRRLLESETIKREAFTSHDSDPVNAVREIMDRIKKHLASMRREMGDIIQARIMLPRGRLSKLPEVNSLYAAYFKDHYPIRSSAAGLGDKTSIVITF